MEHIGIDNLLPDDISCLYPLQVGHSNKMYVHLNFCGSFSLCYHANRPTYIF